MLKFLLDVAGINLDSIFDSVRTQEWRESGENRLTGRQLFEAGRFANPICGACEGGCVEALELLIERGAPLDLCDANGLTPLICAIMSVSLSCVKKLLSCGVEETDPESWEHVAVIDSVLFGHLDILRALIATDRFRLGVKNRAGITPLSMAIWTGGREILEWVSAREPFLPKKPVIEAILLKGRVELLRRFTDDEETRRKALRHLIACATSECRRRFLGCRGHWRRDIWVPGFQALLAGWSSLVSSFPDMNPLAEELIGWLRKARGNRTASLNPFIPDDAIVSPRGKRKRKRDIDRAVQDSTNNRTLMALLALLAEDEHALRRMAKVDPPPNWMLMRKWSIQQEGVVLGLMAYFGLTPATGAALIALALNGRRDLLIRMRDKKRLKRKMLESALDQVEEGSGLVRVPCGREALVKQILCEVGAVDRSNVVRTIMYRPFDSVDAPIQTLQIGYYQRLSAVMSDAGVEGYLSTGSPSSASSLADKFVENRRGFQLSERTVYWHVPARELRNLFAEAFQERAARVAARVVDGAQPDAGGVAQTNSVPAD